MLLTLQEKSDMPLLTKEEAQTILKKALSFSKADECVVNLSGTDNGNIRYAISAVSTSGGIVEKTLTISSAFGKRMGTASINEFDDATIEKGVRRSEELAKLAPENPEYMPLLGPQEYLESKSYIEATAAISAKTRADATALSLQIAENSKLNAAGYYNNSSDFSAMMNSKGLFAFDRSTSVSFNVTMRTLDGKGSGYASKAYNDVTKLDVEAATRVAAEKASRSVTAKAIEPGKYTVILEPAAGIVLLENLLGQLDARSADEGRSFLSKPNGATKLGEKLIDERVTIYSDPQHPELPTSTWNGDGLPQVKTTWIDKGVIKNLFYSRYWAQKKGVKPVPNPDAWIMEGGTASLEEMIKSTDKGILVTRLWYIRAVDPQTLLFTGLTRDGTFYIENGQIKFPVKNFRFNESPVIMLNNLDLLGKAERTVSGESFQSAMVPPMRIRDFTFSSLSDAV
jgi:predicted Zn-dependent protease